MTPERRRELMEGPLVALQHHVRGHFILHASSVARNGSAVALMGGSGTGKSTVSARLVAAGFDFISDGMTIVAPDTLCLWQGPQRFKLNADSIEEIGVLNAGAYVNESETKRYVTVAAGDQGRAPVLRTVIWVCDGDSERMTALSCQEQLMALMTNVYLAQQLPVVRQALLLQQAASLIERGVIVKRLLRRKTWEILPRVIELITAEM